MAIIIIKICSSMLYETKSVFVIVCLMLNKLHGFVLFTFCTTVDEGNTVCM